MIDAATGWYATPTSVKAVVLDDAGRVLLGLNPRGEWELPGGWPDAADVTLEDTARREVAEESGLDIAVDGFVTALLHRGTGGLPPVALIVVRARVVGRSSLATSDEHSRMELFDVDRLPDPLPDVYRSVIAQTSRDGGHEQARRAEGHHRWRLRPTRPSRRSGRR